MNVFTQCVFVCEQLARRR